MHIRFIHVDFKHDYAPSINEEKLSPNNPLNPCAAGAEFFLEAFVAAIEVVDAVDERIARSGDHRGTLQFGFDLCHGVQPLSARAQDPVQRQIHVLTP